MNILEELNKIENSLPNGFIEGYQFYVSKDLKCDVKEYNGVKVNYINVMPLKTIYYAPNIYSNEN